MPPRPSPTSLARALFDRPFLFTETEALWDSPPDGLGPDYTAEDIPSEDTFETFPTTESWRTAPRQATPRQASQDRKDYTHYLVGAPATDPNTLGLLSGWYYREDAQEAKTGHSYPVGVVGVKVWSRAGAVRVGLDPRLLESWLDQSTLPGAVPRKASGKVPGKAAVPKAAPKVAPKAARPGTTERLVASAGPLTAVPWAKRGPLGGNTKIQSLLFARESFTQKEAAAWATAHNFTVTKPPEGQANYWRIRQVDPRAFHGGIRTITLTEGVKATVGLAVRSLKGGATPPRKVSAGARTASPKQPVKAAVPRKR